ncbi:hypothetical protein HDU87_000147 [Geranomyces variabilis]|uniref:6-pyruvoyltetrahydropterin synthase n=1 Tax=Geranomyces variabilis TaxID=109894 RepID=A0AAD5TUZ7_9FUNG|nr:hypothetical protein HDU87_000147 [Geranomyces variabilis]
MPIVYLSREEHFSAAHRLHSPHLSDAENLNVYGKCNHKHGHGHNYKGAFKRAAEDLIVAPILWMQEYLTLLILSSHLLTPFAVEVIVKGELDPKTGMVLNITELKDCMKRAIMEPMDHKNIDIDVPYFSDKPSTAENIAVFMWQEMAKILPKGEMHEIVLRETDANVVIYRGE